MGPKINLLNKAKRVVLLIMRSAEVIIASANAQAAKGDNEKYDAWYNSLPVDQREALTSFQEELTAALQQDGIKDDFFDLLYGAHGRKGLVHLIMPPEISHMTVTVQSALGSICDRAHGFFINRINNSERWKNKNTINCLFSYTTTLEAAHKNWLLYYQSHSSLAVASQSQPIFINSQGDSQNSKSILQTVRDNVTAVSEQASELQRTYSNPESAVASSLPPVPESLARKMAAKKRGTRRTIIPEQDKLLRYLFTIIRFQFFVEGSAWYCPLLFNAAVEDTVFDLVVKREEPSENSSIVIHNKFLGHSQREETHTFIKSIQSFFKDHNVSNGVHVALSANKVELKFDEPQQHSDAIYRLYKEGGYKAFLLFANDEVVEEQNEVSSNVTSSSCVGSKRTSSEAGLT